MAHFRFPSWRKCLLNFLQGPSISKNSCSERCYHLTSISMAPSRPLEGKIALVTGASRGVGRGIALQLGEAGATTYVTSRNPSASSSSSQKELPTLLDTVKEIKNRGGHAIPVYCDHADSNDVQKLFEKISLESNKTLDILVNAAFSGITRIRSERGKKFFESDPLLWDDINKVGLRNSYICCVYASRLMVARRSGLIVNISSAGGIQYFFNVSYGVGKAAIDRMAADMALDLKSYGVAIVSLWPGTVKTEISKELLSSGELSTLTGLNADILKRTMEHGESPEFVGKAVAVLAADPKVINKSGRILLTSDLSREYGFNDIDGQSPSNMRSVSSALDFFGWPHLASAVPSFIKIPCWALHLSSYKF